MGPRLILLAQTRRNIPGGFVLEVFHAGLKLTRTPMSAALMQWAGRTHVPIAVTHAIPHLQTTAAAGILILAWALTEVIRYPLVCSFHESCPGWLNWLRYTIFIRLYPIGGGLRNEANVRWNPNNDGEKDVQYQHAECV